MRFIVHYINRNPAPHTVRFEFYSMRDALECCLDLKAEGGVSITLTAIEEVYSQLNWEKLSVGYGY